LTQRPVDWAKLPFPTTHGDNFLIVSIGERRLIFRRKATYPSALKPIMERLLPNVGAEEATEIYEEVVPMAASKR
jgi:hypothetical protein